MWWLVTTDRKKKNPYGLYGPFNSKFDAQREADKLEVDSEAVELDTRDLGRATHLVKGKLTGEHPGKFRETTSRYSHKR